MPRQTIKYKFSTPHFICTSKSDERVLLTDKVPEPTLELDLLDIHLAYLWMYSNTKVASTPGSFGWTAPISDYTLARQLVDVDQIVSVSILTGGCHGEGTPKDLTYNVSHTLVIVTKDDVLSIELLNMHETCGYNIAARLDAHVYQILEQPITDITYHLILSNRQLYELGVMLAASQWTLQVNKDGHPDVADIHSYKAGIVGVRSYIRVEVWAYHKPAFSKEPATIHKLPAYLVISRGGFMLEIEILYGSGAWLTCLPVITDAINNVMRTKHPKVVDIIKQYNPGKTFKKIQVGGHSPMYVRTSKAMDYLLEVIGTDSTLDITDVTVCLQGRPATAPFYLYEIDKPHDKTYQPNVSHRITRSSPDESLTTWFVIPPLLSKY